MLPITPAFTLSKMQENSIGLEEQRRKTQVLQRSASYFEWPVTDLTCSPNEENDKAAEFIANIGQPGSTVKINYYNDITKAFVEILSSCFFSTARNLIGVLQSKQLELSSFKQRLRKSLTVSLHCHLGNRYTFKSGNFKG